MRVFSGIQPTGAKHFGNYSGGFRQYARSQDLGDAYFCIVDLHSITVGFEPADLRTRTLDVAAMLLATGVDPERSVVFVQSHVPEHTEAAWLLASLTSFGELRRMTQFKEKSEGQTRVSAGLFMYPVLMAADIMLYQTDRVPIGDDQRQHLELTRHLVERFNRRYGETFRVPEGIFPEVGARIMDLQDPRRKMSTTGGTELGTIGILDPPEVVSRKVKSAVTDPESEVRLDPDRKPGISNLMEIMYVATGEAIDSIEARNVARGYGAFKQEVADAVIAVLEPVREAYGPIRADETELRRVLAMGSAKARAMSAPTLDRMRDAMGFVRRESRP